VHEICTKYGAPGTPYQDYLNINVSSLPYQTVFGLIIQI